MRKSLEKEKKNISCPKGNTIIVEDKEKKKASFFVKKKCECGLLARNSPPGDSC